MDPKLAVHHGIRVGTDLRGARGVTKAGQGGPREINHVLSAGRVWARNDLHLAQLIERGLWIGVENLTISIK
jgi:hypothetical protein